VVKSKLVHINKNSDKPKRSAFKCPTLHIQYVGNKHRTKKNRAKKEEPTAYFTHLFFCQHSKSNAKK
jgi:hypothetical protein